MREMEGLRYQAAAQAVKRFGEAARTPNFGGLCCDCGANCKFFRCDPICIRQRVKPLASGGLIAFLARKFTPTLEPVAPCCRMLRFVALPNFLPNNSAVERPKTQCLAGLNMDRPG